MAKLVWDQIGDRVFEGGVDRGVLYPDKETGVPWNGLVAVVEKPKSNQNSVFYDGVKIAELITPGDFQGTIKALTYPDEFLELEGSGSLGNGLYGTEQPPRAFDLSYRTLIGNDVDGTEAGYKIHILYNVFAVPSDKERTTAEEEFSVVEFEWDIFAIPDDIDKFRPTAHFVIDSRQTPESVLIDLEDILYGDAQTEASMISVSDLVDIFEV